MSTISLQGKLLPFVYWYHRRLEWIWWLPTAAVCGYGLLALRPNLAPALALWLPALLYPAIAVAALCALAFAFWLASSGWHGVWFRYLAWLLARAVGLLWRWLTTGWRAALVVVMAVALALWCYRRAAGRPYAAAELLSSAFGLRVAAGAALLAAVSWAYQARRRMVILAFANHTGNPEMIATVEGISSRLLNELARLSMLYQIVDQARPNDTRKRSLTLDVVDTGAQFRAAISADQKVKLGPLEIPIEFVFGVANRAMQGPRVSGGLYMENDRLMLIAKLGGGGQSGDWRVSAADLDDSDRLDAAATPTPTDTLQAMIEQLAYRMFTDLVRVGSPRWRAVQAYTQGLACYRDALRTQRDRVGQLRNAERAFMQALANDNQFAQCHFNLGVVYLDLSENESAKAAFGSVVATQSDHYQAYRELAFLYSGAYDETQRLCERLIRLCPGDAWPWNQQGLARGQLKEQQLKRQLSKQDRRAVEADVAPSLEVAVKLAWRGLCLEALRDPEGAGSSQSMSDLCIILSNLSNMYWQVERLARCKALLMQALFLQPHADWLEFQLGVARYRMRDWPGALRAFGRLYEASRQPADRAWYWAYVASASAHLHEQARRSDLDEQARRARAHFASVAYQLDDDTLDAIAASIDGLEEICRRVKETRQAQEEAEDDYARRLEDKLGEYQDKPVDYAQVAAALAQLLENSAAGRAADLYGEAIQRLKEEFHTEIVSQSLYRKVAEIHYREGDLQNALLSAECDARLNPEDAGAHFRLAQVYAALNCFERAEREFNISRDLLVEARFSSELFSGIVNIVWNRWLGVHNPQQRKLLAKQVVDLLRRTLRMSEGLRLQPGDQPELIERGRLNYWLGQAYGELMRCDDAATYFGCGQEAIDRLRIAQEMGFRLAALTAQIIIFAKMEAYDEAERAYRAARQEASRQYRDLLKNTPPPASGTRQEQTRARIRQALSAVADGPSGIGYTIEQLLVGIDVDSAFALAQRGANLNKARRRLRYAQRRLVRLGEFMRQQYHPLLLDSLGLIALQDGNPRTAIDALEQSVASSANAGTYYRLACAYFEQMRSDKRQRDRSLDKARDACDRADKIDLLGEYRPKITELRRQIQDVEGAARAARTTVPLASNVQEAPAAHN